MRTSCRKTDSQAGWTLIETLIVIAIVMVLTATVGFMAVGSLEKARIAGARAQTRSALHWSPITLTAEIIQLRSRGFLPCGRNRKWSR